MIYYELRIIMYIEVVFDLPFSQRFTYSVPPALEDAVQRGVRVLTPFGKRKTTGYIVGVLSNPPQNVELRQIEDVLDTAPVFSDEIMRLAEWVADYYLCGFGEALKAAHPAGMNIEYKRVVKLVQNEDASPGPPAVEKNNTQKKILDILYKKEKVRFDTLEKLINNVGIAYSIRKLEDEGVIQLEEQVVGRSHYNKFEKYLRLNHSTSMADQNTCGQNLPKKQQQILDYLQTCGGSARQRDALNATKSSWQTLKALVRAGYVEAYERRVERDYYGDLKVPPAPKLILNKDQQRAVDRICGAVSENKPKTFLIHGVTGSGKTQVYIESIRHAIEANKGAIVLVPEISLTPQAVRRFRSEFQHLATVVHSKMSTGERYDAWQKIREGRARVVVGPRSAIFSPVQNLGLIVVDEEHEGSYKQSDNAPRYNARDVAVVRAVFANAIVVLGTATPSMESYQNARRGKYELIEMAKRIDDIPMPDVNLLNLLEARKKAPKAENFVLSNLLLQKIASRLKQKEQVIILQNRRGFSTAVSCSECGHVEMCPNCNISLSYHLKGLRMRCHYCELNQKAPAYCPNCRSVEIRYSGVGTQKVEVQLQEFFPEARITRMDFDTTRGKKAHDKILQDFGEHKYDILVGTQMIAKGLDFPKVTLVGVISADTGLYMPDFRATERTFQLLTQVAGRAGRKDGQGEVIIQTYSTKHYCLLCAKGHDFKKFFYYELVDRRALNYPPFSRLALLQMKHKDEKKAWRAALHLASLLKAMNTVYEILGPSPAPLAKLQQYFRFQIILKSNRKRDPSARRMRAAIKQAVDTFRKESGHGAVNLTIDIDPMAIL